MRFTLHVQWKRKIQRLSRCQNEDVIGGLVEKVVARTDQDVNHDDESFVRVMSYRSITTIPSSHLLRGLPRCGPYEENTRGDLMTLIKQPNEIDANVQVSQISTISSSFTDQGNNIRIARKEVGEEDCLKNMMSKQGQEETVNNQMDPMKVMRRMQQHMDEIHRKYEEEIQIRRTKFLSTLNLSGPTKQPWEEPDRMVQANSFTTSKDHRYFVATVNTVDMLLSITGTMEEIYVISNSIIGQTLASMDSTKLTIYRTSCVTFQIPNQTRELGSGYGKWGVCSGEIWGHKCFDEVVGLRDIVSFATNSEKPLNGAHLDLVGSFKPSIMKCDDKSIRRGRMFIDNKVTIVEATELGEVLAWFSTLSVNSIDCFATIQAKFGAHFATIRPHQLVNVRHEKDESLWSFMERFKKVSLHIQNLSPNAAMHPFLIALQPRIDLESQGVSYTRLEYL
ncbi:hypothetical protein V8G54_019288 [Vigna mungo]|uniref:Retrotransposon gag domain-containing protein n=1 Tax=Vigna mungo TaxID=3915 RepID=A0AAQ3RTK8_VIGMU